MTQTKRALLIRLDRIGDLVLTLPADRQQSLRDYECHWMISKNLGFVADHANPPRKYRELNKEFSVFQFLQFFFFVRALQPDVSVSFHAPWWINLALFLARVPRRIGVLSQWHSYLFLNRGVRQKRSLCQHHELEYNHLLVRDGMGDTTPPTYPHLPLTARWESLPMTLPSKYTVIHPGMSGSALNWPVEHYSELIKKISTKTPVIITGTKSDSFILEPLQKYLATTQNIYWMQEKFSSPQLLRVLKGASAVFAPSTGVIHLAASLGVPTFGIYSPIKVESAERWGPRGDRVKIATPPSDPMGHHDKALAINSMALVTPQEIYDSINTVLN